MATRYQNIIDTWSSNSSTADDILNETEDQVFEEWFLNMIIEWHNDDPVSQREIDRNNEVYAIQGNRNPFIDYPDFVDAIFGSGTNPTGISKNLEISNVKIFPNPAKEEINIELENGNSLQSIIVYNLIGEKVLDNDDVNGSFYTFKVNNLPKGVYFLQVDCLNNSFVQKIIIK